jgi:hypothetical protein
MMPLVPSNTENNPPRVTANLVGDERGFALVLAIAMLAILSLLGLTVLLSSDTEMKVTGNYQVAKQTFWVADRAVEYATSRGILMALDGSTLDLLTGGHKELIEAGGGGVLTAGTVTDLGPGTLPTKIADAYGSDFGVNYYQVSVTAQQNSNPNSAAVQIDASIVRVFKNDDESIFITKGEG